MNCSSAAPKTLILTAQNIASLALFGAILGKIEARFLSAELCDMLDKNNYRCFSPESLIEFDKRLVFHTVESLGKEIEGCLRCKHKLLCTTALNTIAAVKQNSLTKATEF